MVSSTKRRPQERAEVEVVLKGGEGETHARVGMVGLWLCWFWRLCGEGGGGGLDIYFLRCGWGGLGRCGM